MMRIFGSTVDIGPAHNFLQRASAHMRQMLSRRQKREIRETSSLLQNGSLEYEHLQNSFLILISPQTIQNIVREMCSQLSKDR